MDHTKGSYITLLASLLIIFALTPFVAGSTVMRWVLSLATVGMMASALLASWKGRKTFIILALFGVTSIVFTAIGETIGGSFVYAAGDAVKGGFMLVVTGVIFADVLRSKQVTMNTVFGSCCVYLLLSLTWSAAYAILETVQPGSFNIALASAGETGDALPTFDVQLVYFSLITLTTVGFGDITPVTPQARILAALEGLIGQLFLAIIVARLVALEIASRIQRRP
jgi:hypothetical protein